MKYPDNITSIDQIYKILDNPNSSIYDKVSYSDKIKTNNKVKNIQLGRLWFNLLLPNDYPLIDESITGKKVNNILSDIATKYPAETAEKVTRTVNEECLKMSSYYPATFNADSLKLPDQLLKRKKEFLTADLNPEEFSKRMTMMGNEYIEYLKSIDSGLYDISKAGASKSSPTDLSVFFIAKGPVSAFTGEISKPILNNLNSGFTLDEFYASADQARYANFIRASGTAEPGALAREVTYALNNVQLGSNDCRTKKYLELMITSDLRDKINGRYYINEKTNDIDIITPDTQNLVGKVIRMRSPIYCKEKNNNICHICYGKLADQIGVKHIGGIVGSIINIEGVNGYSMKARHATSQVNVKKVNFLKDLIIV